MIQLPLFKKGELCSLDGKHIVEVLSQTPQRLYTIVKDLETNEAWSTMTYRLCKAVEPAGNTVLCPYCWWSSYREPDEYGPKKCGSCEETFVMINKKLVDEQPNNAV